MNTAIALLRSLAARLPGVSRLGLVLAGWLAVGSAQAQIAQANSPGPLTLTISQSDLCQGGSATLTARGGYDPGASVSYTWSPNQDLSGTTGDRVVVAPLLTTTYTLTSYSALSDTPTQTRTVTVTVNTNCCQLNSGATIVDLPYDEYGEVRQYPNSTPPGFYRPDPFAAYPPGTYFRVASGNSLTLINMEFNLPAGSVLLMGPGKDVILDDARLNMNGGTITAECDEMWGTLRMPAHAHDINLRRGGTIRSRIMHSLGGVTVDNAANTPAIIGTPLFTFSDCDFLHNYQSLSIERRGGVYGSNYVKNCVFDSDPEQMKLPYQATPGNYNYTHHHLRLDGDFQDVEISNNVFRHALTHVLFEHGAQHPNVRLTDSEFGEFYVAGILQGDVSNATLDPTRAIATDNSHFVYFTAAAAPNTPQVNDFRSQYAEFLPPGVPGISSLFALLNVTNSTFTQPDANSYGTFEYEAQRTEQEGISGRYVNQVLSNTFTGLHLGIRHKLASQDTRAEVKGNLFTECVKGYVFMRGSENINDAGTAWLDCNTFTRGVSAQERPGTAYGIYVEQDAFTWIDDPSTAPMRNITFLRNRFDVNNFDPSEFEAIHNDNGGFTLQYYTYDDIKARYDPFISPNVNISNPGNQDSSPGNECAPDFPGVGIQRLMASSSSSAPSTGPVLEQNAPNPAQGQTTFYYHLPAKTRQAELLIRRATDGYEVGRVPVNPAASQQEANVRAYPAGLYFYTLLADGVPVATKRLVVQ